MMIEGEFPINVTIRRVADGVTRVHRDEYGSNWRYMYGEGNYSCDCNRSLFFADAGGEDEQEDVWCGDEAYAVDKIARADTGEVLTDVDPSPMRQAPCHPPKIVP